MEDTMPKKPRHPCGYPGCPALTDRQYCPEHQKLVSSHYNRYERDPRARKACLDFHGPICQACGIDLRAIYGPELGTRAVHVHHIRPMASHGGKPYKLDPKKDLVPLCPNCHNVIHKTDPVLTPRQFVKQILSH